MVTATGTDVPRAQGQYPLGGLSPPIGRFDLLVYGQVEDPPVHNGAAVLPRPASGGTVQFQIFVPSAARKQAFGYILEFDDTNRMFSDHFEIRSVTTWMPIYDISGVYRSTPEGRKRPRPPSSPLKNWCSVSIEGLHLQAAVKGSDKGRGG